MRNEKKIGLVGLTSIGIGSVIGAGIFSMLGTGIAFTGRSVALALILAVLINFLQNFLHFILSGIFVLDGGRYEQFALTMPPLVSGAMGVNLLLQNLSRSVMAIGIAQYLAAIFPNLNDHMKLTAFIVMTLAFAASLLGNGFIAKVQTIIVVCMYISLGLFAVFGIINRNPAAYAGEPLFYGGMPGLLAASVALTYACQGSVNVIDVAKDAKDAKVQIPRAIILSGIGVAVMYAVLGYAASCSMPYADIAGQSLGVVAKAVMPTGLFLFFVLGGAIGSLATTLLGCIVAMPWPIYSSACDGWLPAVFKKKSQKGYPWVVMLVMYLIAVIPIIGDFSMAAIVSYLLVPASVIALLGNLANFKIPERYPDDWEKRSMRISANGYRVILGISCLFNVIVALVSLSSLDTFNLICNLGMTMLLFLWSWLRIKTNKVNLKIKDKYSK